MLFRSGLPAKTLDATNQTDAANQDPAADTKGQNALELPQDFDVTLRFSILGGGVYRSVGVSFDSTQVDGSINPGPQDSEIMVYVSSHAPDPKVQAAYAANGTYHYPPEGKASHPVELNRETTLRVQVRGTLVNASLNGEPKVAWRSPLARRRGALQFTAFDVQTAFHEITIQSLPQSVPMRDAGGAATLDPEKSFELARLEFEGAKSKRRIAELDVRAMERRHEAWKARWAVQDARAAKESQPGEGSKPLEPLLSEEARLVRESILQDHELAFERANLQATLGEISVLKATADKKEAAQKELASAKEKLAKSKEQWESAQKSEETAGDLARFEGGKWSPTRFFNSGADDPKPAFPETSSGRRSALANWITDPRNPLTARVAVNHLWNRHFGEPLVPNVFDFGNKGGKTPHQKLLDWLAAEFMSHGWSMKHLHRLILTSDAYQRHSSLVDAEAAIGIDPDNRLLWRRNATRIESQVVRDSILSLAGSLDGTIGGPTVPTNQQANSLRRSLYFFHSNNERNLFLTTFDEALVKECYRREQSVVPQQALALSNSQVVLDSSVRIAERLSQSEPDEEAFLRGAFELILGIRADAGMLESSRAAMARWRELPDVGLGQGSAHRERILLVWALLNHNDFVTLR